jgi:hypothetical protein|tara:strand:- start:3694 stop:4692 length:999 start_codon:yes stop_codon:yes gene_type:complete
LKILYKYRPLSEFLFKELYYQELYFASYFELNDPLDLSARIEFSCEKSEQVEYLIYFLFKSTLSLNDALTDKKRKNDKNLLAFNDNRTKVAEFQQTVFEYINQLKDEKERVWDIDIKSIIDSASKKHNLEFQFDSENFKSVLKRISSKFLENSYATCFSESNDDFLMWSHYSSKHSGICLEFALENSGLFPYIGKARRKLDCKKYKERLSKWDLETHVYWDRIKKVNYESEQPFINFFEFSQVFENEHDCDLIGLSKPWTHHFAHQLEWVFSTKTAPWKYEKEWRAIHINFGNPQEPEERIRHYPLESLKAIYFGMRTPENVKKRIFHIFDK